LDPPLLVVRRTWILRIALLLTLAPLGVQLTLTGMAFFRDAPWVCGTVTALGLASLGYVIHVLRRDARLTTSVFDDRIEQSDGGRMITLAFDAVREIWFWAKDTGVGGIYGDLLNAATGTNAKPISTVNTSVHARIVAEGSEVRLSSNDRDVMSALGAIVRRVNPRLLRESLQAVASGELAFGTVRVGQGSVTMGRETILLAEIETCELRKGHLFVKKRGAWLARTVPMKSIPNVLVVVGLLDRLRGRPVDETAGDPRGGKRGAFV
jgi:hypothetical protein